MRRRDRRRFPILLAERPGPVTKLRLKPPSEKLDAAPRTFVTRSAAAAAAKTASEADTCLIRTDSGFRRCLVTRHAAHERAEVAHPRLRLLERREVPALRRDREVNDVV